MATPPLASSTISPAPRRAASVPSRRAGLTQLALLLGCSAVWLSCGDEPPAKPDGIVAMHLQGGWRLASAASGSDTPAAIDCTVVNGTDSRSETMNINATGYRHLVIYYVSATNCQSENRVEIPTEVTLAAAEGDTYQVLTSTFSVIVIGDRAATFLDFESACGHTDWQMQPYATSSQHLRDCTAANAGSLLYPVPTAAEIAAWRVQITAQGAGVSLARKNADEADTAFDSSRSFYAR